MLYVNQILGGGNKTGGILKAVGFVESVTPIQTAMDKRKFEAFAKKYFPTYSHIISGIFFMLFGMLMITGGDIGIKSTLDSDWASFQVPHDLPHWVAWLFIWFGFDDVISKGSITNFVASQVDKRVLKPIMSIVINRIKGEKLNDNPHEGTYV